MKSVKRTAERLRDLVVNIQSSASRTPHSSALYPSSELLGYYHSSALRTDKATFCAKPLLRVWCAGRRQVLIECSDSSVGRANGFQPVGRRFESYSAHQLIGDRGLVIFTKLPLPSLGSAFFLLLHKRLRNVPMPQNWSKTMSHRIVTSKSVTG